MKGVLSGFRLKRLLISAFADISLFKPVGLRPADGEPSVENSTILNGSSVGAALTLCCQLGRSYGAFVCDCSVFLQTVRPYGALRFKQTRLPDGQE
ncbi:MAG: hypothetical protein MUD08_16935 [Cytophagales bacterium]|nr:hypothetical protein [Cytophagales bacterium]